MTLKINDKGLAEMDGIVLEVNANANCKVQLENGQVINAYLKGTIKQPSNKNRILPKDKVLLEIPIQRKSDGSVSIDGSKGRIMFKYRESTAEGPHKNSHSAKKRNPKLH